MNTSAYYTLVVATVIVAEAPSYTARSTSASGDTPLDKTPLERNAEMPATSLEHHTTATVKIENINPYKKALFHSSVSVSRLTKSFNNDYDPYFIQNIYAPAEKKHKIIKVVSFRRNRLQPRIILQVDNKDKEVDNTVAEKQSPFNELPDFSIDPEK